MKNLRTVAAEIIEEKGVDVNEIAERLGVTAIELNSFLKGDGLTSILGGKAYMLCDYLDIPVNSIHPGYFRDSIRKEDDEKIKSTLIIGEVKGEDAIKLIEAIKKSTSITDLTLS